MSTLMADHRERDQVAIHQVWNSYTNLMKCQTNSDDEFYLLAWCARWD